MTTISFVPRYDAEIDRGLIVWPEGGEPLAIDDLMAAYPGHEISQSVLDVVYIGQRRTVLVYAGLEARAQVRQGLADVIEWLHERGVDA